MKKIFTAILLATALIGASAADWRSIGDTGDGNSRLLIDAQSIGSGIPDDGKEPLVYALFRYFANGEMQEPYVYVTFAESCVNGQGVLFRRKNIEGKWVTDKKYWWSTDGDKMYDVIGNILCAAAFKKPTPKQSDKSRML